MESMRYKIHEKILKLSNKGFKELYYSGFNEALYFSSCLFMCCDGKLEVLEKPFFCV